MKTWIFPITVGLVLAIVSVYQLHNFMLEDACLDFGAKYRHATESCVDGEGKEHIITFPISMLLFYIGIGLVIAGGSAFGARKMLAWRGSRHPAT